MIEFGKTLREAREAKGLTIAQLEEQTHVAHSKLLALEDEQFDAFPAPIYARGFIKLYCETVGLDPKPLINEFMEIYNGNREPIIKERPVAPSAPTPVEEPPEAPVEAAIPETRNEPIAEQPPLPLKPPFALKANEIASFETSEEAPLDTPAPKPSDANRLSRYSTPLRDPMRVAASYSRMVLLIVVAIVVLIVIGFGIRALYRATAPVSQEPSPAQTALNEPSQSAPPAKTPVTTKETAAKKTAAKASTPRTPQKIPSLYLD